MTYSYILYVYLILERAKVVTNSIFFYLRIMSSEFLLHVAVGDRVEEMYCICTY